MGVMPMGAGAGASGFGVIRGGLRGPSHDQSAEQLLSNSSRSVSTLFAKATAAVGNDLVMEAGDPVPRLVFGGVPSLEESKEATGELKMYMDAMYLSSPKWVESETSLIPRNSLPWNSETVNTISGVIMEDNTCIPGSKHVHQAVHLLCYSSVIQDIVSSIACDPKVYQAVLNNPEVKKLISSDTSEKEANVTQGGESGEGVMEKLKNVKYFMSKMVSSIPSHLPGLFGSSATESASATGPDHEENPTMKDGKLGSRKNVKDFISKMVTSIPFNLPGLFGSSATESASVSGPDHKENPTMKDGKSGSSFMEKLRNLKKSVVQMATTIPKYNPYFYGSSPAESVSSSDDAGNTQSSLLESSLGTHLIGLAIMVIMVVVFKRV